MTTAYATYTYYTTTYLGTAIASADFARLALRASAIIDQLTFQRAAPIVTVATETATIDSIKMATCAVAEEFQTLEGEGGGGGIKSESIGSNSVTYMDGAKATLSDMRKYLMAASVYLGSTGLIYRGFADGEYSGDVADED